MKNNHKLFTEIKGFVSHVWGENKLVDSFIYQITEPFAGRPIAVNFALPKKSRTLRVAVSFIPEAGKRTTEHYVADLRKGSCVLYRTDIYDFVKSIKIETSEANPITFKISI